MSVVGYALSASRSVFASFRSGVSKPSVNQPDTDLEPDSCASAALTTPRRVKVDSIMGYFWTPEKPDRTVAKTNTFVTDFDEFQKCADVRMRYFGVASPTSTTVGVTRLAVPDFMIEIEAVAVVDS